MSSKVIDLNARFEEFISTLPLPDGTLPGLIQQWREMVDKDATKKRVRATPKFLLFSEKEMDSVKESNPNASSKEIKEILKKKWSEMSKEQKDQYGDASSTTKQTRPKTAYKFYYEAELAKIKQGTVNIATKDISKLISSSWKSLSKDAKQKYEDMVDTTQPKKSKSNSTEKKPTKRPPFEFYLFENRDRLQEENPDETMKEIRLIAMDEWKSLTDDAKQRYKTLSMLYVPPPKEPKEKKNSKKKATSTSEEPVDEPEPEQPTDEQQVEPPVVHKLPICKVEEQNEEPVVQKKSFFDRSENSQRRILYNIIREYMTAFSEEETMNYKTIRTHTESSLGLEKNELKPFVDIIKEIVDEIYQEIHNSDEEESDEEDVLENKVINDMFE